METLLFLLIGLVAGALAGYFFALFKKSGKDADEQNIRMQQARIEQQLQSESERRQEGERRNQEQEQQIQRLLGDNAVLKTEGLALQEKLRDQKQELEQLHEKMNLQFRNLANEILEEKSKKFTDQNKTNLGELLNPLKEKITEFEKRVDENNKESLKWN